MKHVLEKVPIFIILYPELGYLGCQINAARYFNWFRYKYTTNTNQSNKSINICSL